MHCTYNGVYYICSSEVLSEKPDKSCKKKNACNYLKAKKKINSCEVTHR